MARNEAQQWQDWAKGISAPQLQWLSGYLTGLQHSSTQLLELIRELPAMAPAGTAAADAPKLNILFGSKTGNGKKIAAQLQSRLKDLGVEAGLKDMNQYKPAELEQEQILILVVSTHGEGDPPPAAEDLHAFIHSRKAAQLPNLKYAVLALGDKSYASFCQTGKEFDQRLSALGAKRLVERADADVDYEETAGLWIEGVLRAVQQESPQKDGLPKAAFHNGQTTLNSKISPSYNRKKPYSAEVLDKIQLNGRGSAKQTYHLELSLAESGLTYQPGDALGIRADNDAALVDALIGNLGFNPEKPVDQGGKTFSFREWLTSQAEITTVSGAFLKNYQALALEKGAKETAEWLSGLLDNKEQTSAFVYGKDIWDILAEFRVPLSEQEFAGALLPLQPRLYSIASSLSAHPEEVHITAGRVVYKNANRLHKGLVSNFIADQLNVGNTARVFIEHNESFRLPENGDTPLIMVGPGTGIAPFRAFLEERAESGAQGKNWLFFGDQHFSTDFLYQLEWQRFLKNGVLTRLNTAFSRDTHQKIYVQDRMRDHASTLFEWLEEGARFYVCGDAKRMAKDVKKTLIDIVAQQAGVNAEKATEYVKELVKSGRYQEDVY